MNESKIDAFRSNFDTGELMRARDYARYSNVKQRRNTARRIMRRFKAYETINSAVCESDNVWLRGEDGRCLCYGVLNYAIWKRHE